MLTLQQMRGVVSSSLTDVGQEIYISRKSPSKEDTVYILDEFSFILEDRVYTSLANPKAKGLTLIDKYHPKSLIYDNARFIYVSEDGKDILQFTGEVDDKGQLRYNNPKSQPKYDGIKRTQVPIYGTFKTLPQLIAAAQGEQLIDLGRLVSNYINRLQSHGITTDEDIYRQIKGTIQVHHINSIEDDDTVTNLTYLPTWIHRMIHTNLNPDEPTNITPYELYKVLQLINEDTGLTRMELVNIKANRVALQNYLQGHGLTVTTKQAERIRGYLVDLHDPTTFSSVDDLTDEAVAKRLTQYQYLANVNKQLSKGKTELEAYARILSYEAQSFAKVVEGKYTLPLKLVYLVGLN